jgi:hypothetical protein
VATTAFGTSALVLVVSLLPSTEAVLPFVGRIAELALAGGAAYLIDDAAATLTTVAPRGIWRRRAPALAIGTILLASAWVAVVLVLWRRDMAPLTLAASAELFMLSLVALAAAAVLVRYGDPEPGARIGPVVLLLGIGLLILVSVLHRSLLVPWDESPGTGLIVAWAGVGLLALVVALWASRDVAATRAVRR